MLVMFLLVTELAMLQLAMTIPVMSLGHRRPEIHKQEYIEQNNALQHTFAGSTRMYSSLET